MFSKSGFSFGSACTGQSVIISTAIFKADGAICSADFQNMADELAGELNTAACIRANNKYR